MILAALAAAGRATRDSHSSEAHGTGTALGDPIEVGALQRVFSQQTASTVTIGAIKSRIGHAEGAAGFTGLAKVMLVLEQQTLPPDLHLQIANPKISLDRFDVLLPSGLTLHPLDADNELFLGVNSFGYAGTNSHAVMVRLPASRAELVHTPIMRFCAKAFCWFDESAAVAETALLGGYITGDDREQTWEHTWAVPLSSYLADHRVGRTPVAPGTLFQRWLLQR